MITMSREELDHIIATHLDAKLNGHLLPTSGNGHASTSSAVKPPAFKMPIFSGYVGESDKAGTDFITKFVLGCKRNNIDISTGQLLWEALLLHSKGRLVSNWLNGYRMANPDGFSADELTDTFIDRWDLQVRSDSALAMDRLFNGSVIMAPFGTVAEFISRFQDTANLIDAMPDAVAIRWFHHGLSASLKPRCLVDYLGNDFVSLSALIAHTLGEERKLNHARPLSSIPSYSRQGRPGMIHQHRREVLEASYEPGTKRARNEERRAGGGLSGGNGGYRGEHRPQVQLAWVKDLNGNHLPRAEFEELKRAKTCWNCWRSNPGHNADACTAAPRRDYGTKPDMPPGGGRGNGQGGGRGNGQGGGRGNGQGGGRGGGNGSGGSQQGKKRGF
jgi:hypothetical protein